MVYNNIYLPKFQDSKLYSLLNLIEIQKKFNFNFYSTSIEYRMIKKLGEGTFSEVFKAQVVKTGEFVAVKCMKQKYTNIETVNSLREVRSLKRLSTHKNIISLLEVLL